HCAEGGRGRATDQHHVPPLRAVSARDRQQAAMRSPRGAGTMTVGFGCESIRPSWKRRDQGFAVVAAVFRSRRWRPSAAVAGPARPGAPPLMVVRMLSHVVVVGASLAGLRAVETLRAEEFDGRITLVGAEGHLPYDRPPLSKKLLAGAL